MVSNSAMYLVQFAELQYNPVGSDEHHADMQQNSHRLSGCAGLHTTSWPRLWERREFKMAYRVFVSYSTRDLDRATQLQDLITRAGGAPYVAEYSTTPGAALPAALLRAIKDCDLFLLLWSTDARHSDWVPQEIGVAKGAGKSIMPVVLHSGLTLPGFINDLKYLPLYKNPSGALAWLQEHLFAQARKKEQTEALVLLGVGAAILLVLSQKG